jgi:hypothetical protein
MKMYTSPAFGLIFDRGTPRMRSSDASLVRRSESDAELRIVIFVYNGIF